MANGTTLGFVGLGSMGGPMSSRLVDAGHKVVVFDMNPKSVEALVAKGATAAGSLAEVADAAEIVFLSLPTPAAVKAVALGDLNGGKARLIVDLSTTGPRMSAEVAKALEASGRILVDAPVSGGHAGAVKGTLSIMGACPKAAWDEVEPYLPAFGKSFYVGPEAGQGQVVKLINNCLSVIALIASSEGLALGMKAGLDPQVMLDVINVSSGRNSATLEKLPRHVLTGKFDMGFATGLSMKDCRLYLEECDAAGVPTMLGQGARTMLQITQSLLGADSDLTEVSKVIEQWAGTEIRSRA
jgi:3-hydroxyisobutyrate dehydrogenase-like beta-hydroxyacid dehydrogenase